MAAEGPDGDAGMKRLLDEGKASKGACPSNGFINSNCPNRRQATPLRPLNLDISHY